MCSHRARLVLDITEQCCGVCLSTRTDRGSASCSLVLTIAGAVLDRGRNTWARPTSISRRSVLLFQFWGPFQGAVQLVIGKTLAEIAEIAERGLPAPRNRGYRSAVASVSASNVSLPNPFKDLEPPA